MAKGNNNIRNKKPHSSKPYDVSNSFVKKVTSGVSSLLPQTSWLSRWFASTTTAVEDTPATSTTIVGDDHEQHVSHSPPTKRARIPLNRSFPANSFRVSSPIDRGETHPWPSESVTSPIPNVFSDSAVAGPSGLGRTPIVSGPFQSTSAAVEGLEGKINGDGGSDSSESTSGCSSLAPQRAPSSSATAAQRSSVDTKMPNHISSYSLFPSATHKLSTSINPSLSRRRPSFNVSSFGSPNLDSSKLSRESSLNSPFYIGRTMYGGASAYRRPREGASSESFLSSTRRGGITVRPANEKTQSGASAETSMSQTARRILEALEQFSSPVSDARRMPLPPQPALGSKRKRRLEISPAKSPAIPAAVTNPLTIPMPPERLRLHRLQDITEAARRIASSVTSSNDKYTIRSNDDGTKRSGTGKVTKSKPLDEDEQPLPVNLPHVSLPITTLPSFDLFKVPMQTTSAISRTSSTSAKLTVKDGENSDKVEQNKTSCAVLSPAFSGTRTSNVDIQTPTANSGTDSYNLINSSVNPKGKAEKSNSMYSSDVSNSSVVSPFMVKGAPISTVRADSGKTPLTNDYFFSNPAVLPSSRSKETTDSKMSNFDFCKPEVLDSGKYNSKVKRNEPNGFHKLNSNSKLDNVKEPVVLNASRKEISGKTSASRESVCGTQNVATKTGTTERTQNNGWGAKFSVPDSWECSSCLVRNKNDVKVCVCCGSKAPSSTQSESKNIENKNPTKDKDSPHLSSWGSKFALQKDMWECSTCLIRNKADDDKCVACTVPRPVIDKPGAGTGAIAAAATVTGKIAGAGDWGSQFKLTSGKWECSVCLVRNEDKDEKCVSCTTLRKTKASNNKSQDQGGEVKSQSDWGHKFKKPSDSWECPVCMIQNKSSVLKCAACQEPKPGIDTYRSSTGGSIKFNFEMPSGASNFKFGIDKAELKQPESTNATFTFGGNAKTEATGAPAQINFKFGASPGENKIPSGIKFGISVTDSSIPAVKPTPKVGESVTPATPESISSQTSGLSQKPLLQTEISKTPGFSFGISSSSSKTPVSESPRESKKLASTNENDSSKKELKFTVSQASPVVSGAEETENKGTSFVAPLQNVEQKSVKEVKQGFNFGSTTSASVPLSTSSVTIASTAVTKAGGFTFQLNTPSSCTTTTVATSTTSAVTAPVSSSSLFAFGSNSPSFKPATTSASTFSFGSPSTQTTSSGMFGTVSTGQFKSTSDGVFPSKPVTSTTSVFGSSPTPPKTVSSLPSFASITTTNTPSALTSTTTASTNVATFGNSSTSVFATPTATTAAVAFGSGITKPTFANVSTGFGSVTTAGAAATSTTVTTSNSAPTPSPSFAIPTTTGSFGVPVSSSSFNTTNVPTFGSSTTPSGFGVTTTTASIPTSTPTPSFGATTPVAFGSGGAAGAGTSPAGTGVAAAAGSGAATTGNSFGATNVTQSFSTTTSNVFGSANPPTFGSAPTPAFGATPAATNFGNTFGGSATTTASAFGTAAQAVTTTTSANTLPAFGGFSNASKPAQGIFLFGSNPTTTAQSSNFAFNVGSQASGGQGAISGSAAFTFGSGAASSATNVTTSTSTTPTATAAAVPVAAAAPAFGGFSFAGATSAAVPGAPTPSLFGSANPAAPVFGAPPMPSSTPAPPAFGAGSAQGSNVFRPPSFNFSSGSQQPFSFGSNAQSGTAPATGFSFGQGQAPTQSQSQPLQFNPNMRPTFNFTGGDTPQFTASASPNPQRRVKKAVRRTQRP